MTLPACLNVSAVTCSTELSWDRLRGAIFPAPAIKYEIVYDHPKRVAPVTSRVGGNYFSEVLLEVLASHCMQKIRIWSVGSRAARIR